MKSMNYQEMPKRLAIVTTLIVLSLLGANLLVSNILATTGEHLISLQQRTTSLVDQNNQLQAQILKLSSLESIHEKAMAMGFYESDNILSISLQEPVALHKP
jgi:cell division protein FtsL